LLLRANNREEHLPVHLVWTHKGTIQEGWVQMEPCQVWKECIDKRQPGLGLVKCVRVYGGTNDSQN
jgi:hypothetical protein